MASSADAIIGTLLQGTGFGRTVADNQQQNLQIQQGQQGLQLGQLQIDAYHQQQAQAAQEKAAYDQWQAGFLKDPTANNLMTGITRFPKQYQALKAGWDIKDEAAKTADLGYFTQLHSALDAGRSDLAQTLLQQRIDAEKRAGKDTSVDDSYLDALKSGDTSAINALKGVALGGIAVGTGPDKFASTYKAVGDSSDGYTLTPGAKRFDKNNTMVASAPAAETNALEVPVFDPDGHRIGTRLISNGGKGGDPVSSGGAAGTGDTSRLVNTDAGGGYVPDNVKTLGQFVTYGKALNARGAKSSSAGTYQINGSTMAEFAPKALGPDWKSQPFNADSQEKIGEAIFNWAKLQPNSAAALRGRWVSLSPQKAAQLVQGNWQQARETIAQGETGGGSGASADQAAGGNNGYIGPVGAASGGAAQIKPGDITSVPQNIRGAVQAIADGRAAAPRAGTRNGEAILDAVTAYDPTFDAANATSRLKTRTDFTSGSSAKSITAMNTAMGHLMHLDDQAHDLGNFSTLPGLINPLYNSIRSAAGNTSLPAFNQTKQAAASELRKVFAGAGGGNLHELEAFEANLDSSKSPEQLHAVIKNAVDLLSSRLTALRDQYSQGMGRSDTLPTFIKPSIVRSAKQRFGIDLGNGDQAPQQSASKPAPSSGWGRAQVVR